MSQEIELIAKGLTRMVGVIGSLFVKVGADGKLNVAVAPTTALLLFSIGTACALQSSEPFSVCVRNTTEIFEEVAHAL